LILLTPPTKYSIYRDHGQEWTLNILGSELENKKMGRVQGRFEH
jgi:hypothetical protein